MTRGISRYVSVLSSLRAKPRTVAELAVNLGTGVDSIYPVISQMHRARIIHIKGWHAKPRTACVPIYALGDKEDAVYPPTRFDGGQRTKGRDHKEFFASELAAFITAFKALKESSLTRQEIGEVSGYYKNSCQKLVGELRAKRMLFISEWRTDTLGRPVPAFTFGIGKADLPKPLRSYAEVSRRYRQRKAHLEMIQRLAGPANVGDFAEAA